MTTQRQTIKTVRIKAKTPTDSEISQLRDVGSQITKYIYSKVHAHPLSNNKTPIKYKDVFKDCRVVVVLPDSTKEVNKTDIEIIQQLRSNIRNIVIHGKRHEIDIQIE